VAVYQELMYGQGQRHRPWLGLLVGAAYVAFATAGAAVRAGSAVAASAPHPGVPLISTQYQGVKTDTEAKFATAETVEHNLGPQAPSIGRTAAGAVVSRGTRAGDPPAHSTPSSPQPGSRWYHSRDLQYQLRSVVPLHERNLSENFAAEISPVQAYKLASSSPRNRVSISDRQGPHPKLIPVPRSGRAAERTTPPISSLHTHPTARSARGDPAGTARIADARRLFQIALAFGIAYVLFLALWFWATRDRQRRVGGAAGF
jgi:hypothetical protein